MELNNIQQINPEAFDIFDFKEYSERVLKIRDKKAQLVSFKMKTSQKKLDAVIEKQMKEGKPVRVIILKARQMGFSTYTEGRLFHRTITTPNYKTGIITHKDDATTNLFNMTKRFYDNLPQFLKPEIKASNSKELIFNKKDGSGLDSSVKCMTAGAKVVGRSDTFQAIHGSEVAFWEGDAIGTLQGLMQSIPNEPNTMIILESTANGFNFFKDLVDKASLPHNDPRWNGFELVFFGWNEEPEYRIRYTNFKLTPEEIYLKSKYRLDNEQIAWRRYAISNLCFGDINMFHQEYPINPEEAFIATGRTVFNKTIVIERIQEVFEPKKRLFFEYVLKDNEIRDIEVVQKNINDSDGLVKIWEEPKEYIPYVIGVDTADGGGDQLVAHVLDNTTGKQVASMVDIGNLDFFTLQLYCLGMYYNIALIGIETNLTTYPTKKLEELNYPNQYVRERLDSYNGKTMQTYGFKTTVATKTLIISQMQQFFREHPEMIVDIDTLKEMLTFVEKDGKKAAENGYYDDRVMAMAIAIHLFLSDQQEHIPKKEIESGIKKKDVFDYDDDIFDENGKGGYLTWD